MGYGFKVAVLPSGAAILTVSVANNIGFGEKQQTLWIRVSLWGKRAEGNLKDWLKKGQQVFVSGELSVNEYQAKDGTTKTSLELNANIIDLIGKKSEGGQTQNSTKQDSTAYEKPVDDLPYDDDIPF